MKCLILAAGYATRLYPLTENFPKPLLKVGDKTILDWLIEDIHTSNLVDEYIVISNHKFAKHFRDWASAHTLPITVVDDGTSTNETRLGAVCDMQFAIESLYIIGRHGIHHDEGLSIERSGNHGASFSILRHVGNKSGMNAG